MIYYTSDTHFGHANIIKYAGRYKYCQTVQEMDNLLIERWNERVTPCDTVIHLGDVAWREFNFARLGSLNGTKKLIKGNHDTKLLDKLSVYFDIVDELIVVDNANDMVLCHYPIYDWPQQYYGYIHLHGHTHGSKPVYNINAVDIGVDCWGLYPVTLDEIRQRIGARKQTADELSPAPRP